VFDDPRTDAWTGVIFGARESLVWLASTQAGRLCRMAVEPRAVASGLVDPMFPASAVAVVGEGELAYLTWRAAEGARDRRERAEVGVIGHSRTGAALTDLVAAAIRVWDTTYRQRSVRFEIPAHRTDSTDARRGRFFLDRPHNPITVVWQ
jgi:protein-L-isoaspartate(D-aspartate) O-methyltransferase